MKKFKKLMSALLACAMLLAIAIPVASVAADDPIEITIETVESTAGAKNVGVKVFMPTGWSGVGFTFHFDPAKLTFKRFEQNLAVQHQARDGEPNTYVLNKENAATGEVIVAFASAVVYNGVEGYCNVDVDDDAVYDYFGILVFDVAEGAEGLQEVTAVVDKFIDPEGDIAYNLTNGGIQLPGGEEPPVACEHEWGEWEVTTPATCVAEGEQKRVCSKCGAEETEVIPVDENAHDWGEWADSPDKEGYEQRVCKNDPSHVEEREKEGGEEPPVNPDAIKIVIETVESTAGAKNVGVKVFMPTGWSGVGFTFHFDPAKLTFKRFEQNLAVRHQARDGEPNTYVLNKENAATGEVIVAFASAVVYNGVEGYCNVDVDDDAVYDYFGILVFDVAEGIEDGLYEVTAVVDKFIDPEGDVEYALTNGGIKLGADECEHEWEETSRTPATCSEKGSITYTCSKCGETKTEDIDIDEEAHDWVEIGRTPATCTEKGSIQYACSINPDHTKEEEIDIDPDAHDWGEWEDCADQEGWEQRVCKNNPEHVEKREKSVEPPVHEHTFGEPTYTWAEDNSTCTATRTCTADDCDETETETVTATSETTPATTEAEGKTVYNATFTNSAFETQTKEVTIPKLTPSDPEEPEKTEPEVTGVEDGKTYDVGKGEKPAPTWEPADAEGTLNGKPYTPGTEITEPGEYELVVKNGDKTTTIKFTVTDSTASGNNDQPNTSDIAVAGIAIVALIASAAVVVIARKKRFAR